MKAIILLDIDGVLNPHLCPGSGLLVRLTSEKRALVRRLSRSGRIAWVSTWPGSAVTELDSQLQLDVEPLRVPMLFSREDAALPTPKLRSVTQWLYRMDTSGNAAWQSVVWIDDILGPNARKWSDKHPLPVHLEQPDPSQGLTERHVVRVEEFLAVVVRR